ncbi:LPS translocon maturation chaperone LptM [Shewanella sp. AS16]|uniref:LPS translocon maturation chaperone LptM n=1 Tax=Shewanella sp. AS16 TaxID=2907625 RepID=UPI003FA3466E
MLTQMRLLLLLMLASLFTSACGQKGPLYKTPATEANRPAVAEPAADTPAGQTQSQQQ